MIPLLLESWMNWRTTPMAGRKLVCTNTYEVESDDTRRRRRGRIEAGRFFAVGAKPVTLHGAVAVADLELCLIGVEKTGRLKATVPASSFAGPG
jgi:hypothetical protein